MSGKRLKNTTDIPRTFQPKFWEHADQRFGVVQEIRKRYELLKDDTGCDSYQKDMLCQRAIFMGIQLETMERESIETGKFNPGIYTQMVNALLGLLRALGLDRQSIKEIVSLQNYVSEQA